MVTLLDLAAWELPHAYQRGVATRFGQRLRGQLLREAAAVIVTLVLAVVILFSTIFTLADFNIVYVLTKGGPMNMTHLFATYSFALGLQSGQIGQGAAVSLFLFAILLIILFAGGSFWDIFPLRGLTSDNWLALPWYGKILDYFWHLTLPIISMARCTAVSRSRRSAGSSTRRRRRRSSSSRTR